MVVDEVLAQQVSYYRKRAAEYDVTAYGDVTAARVRINRLVTQLKPTGEVLEIACGTGIWTAALAPARATTIRHLAVDAVDLPNRRITLDAVAQPLGSLTHRALRSWLEYRRGKWPHTPNRHLVFTRGTALGVGLVGHT